ncbi:bifunctional DNA-formamidopyrimidine glycosylase/DNA-(apurinic or apyrimidinic site) lyase [Ancylobacter sp. A5.8]|uniref:bifunctional DNA-formamidopyrimidine glycosylase/DNA-(apurinic or apyrimidinic site) lyase n=1 Tax=Ancylobacter gelatini TaxID=2919920 RepID=UPI001F4E1304|nr:bifunctional DNA-formamidopyrimidine glycosylase/DNA-(apurinic or apyrimidinic site) lyase [Ancylobacter gelatini]MCJ8143722.1 bifunctional DNA-formamidopyrimidine glycosylase/DNA-(apurinic or apyrimidinic site) lyase [Ancylobacter gelatini]
MPELPEVETVRRGLAPVMEGRLIMQALARRPDLRWPLPERFAERLSGRRVESLGRRAKYLLADLSPVDDVSEGGEVLVMHLGMSGSFRIEMPEVDVVTPGAFALPRSTLETHDHVVLDIEGGARVVYNDPRRFGAMLLVPRGEIEAHPLFRDIGPEPLGNAFDAGRLIAASARRASSLKATLLDQKVVAGLGNIYVCEALHRAGLAPERPASTLTDAEAERLVEAIRLILNEAILAGGSTLRDHAQVDGTLGYFQHRFRAYDREGELCTTPGCGGRIARLVQNARSTFYCAACQR